MLTGSALMAEQAVTAEMRSEGAGIMTDAGRGSTGAVIIGGLTTAEVVDSRTDTGRGRVTTTGTSASAKRKKTRCAHLLVHMQNAKCILNAGSCCMFQACLILNTPCSCISAAKLTLLDGRAKHPFDDAIRHACCSMHNSTQWLATTSDLCSRLLFCLQDICRILLVLHGVSTQCMSWWKCMSM